MFKFNALPGLHFTDAYGTKGNPANDTSNPVTLTGTGGGQFASKAAITITGYDFTKLDLSSQSLTINISGGTIRNKDNTLQISTPNLKTDEVRELEGTGSLSGGNVSVSAPVTLTGIIVVTSTGTIGTSLTVGGGGGVGGTLTLTNDDGGTYVKIQTGGSSTLTISKDAYDTLSGEYKTQTHLKIGASNSTVRVPANAKGGAEKVELNKEECFKKYWHLLTSDRYDPEDLPDPTVASPALMVIIGMGLVYCIYPGIAPGMIVPFYLIDKIETVLLVLTTFPPVIIAILQKLDDTKGWSPKTTIRKDPPNGLGGWRNYTHPYGAGNYDTRFYHGFDLLMIIKMSLLVIFIYCLHYRELHSY